MSLEICGAFVFLISLFVLGYTYCGYAALISFLAKFFSNSPGKDKPVKYPSVSVVVVAYNEETRLKLRLDNLLASNYPIECLELVIVSDGSTDQTVSLVRNYSDPRVKLISVEQRSGKPNGLNLGIAAASNDIIVLTDVRQRFESETIRQLVENFTDPQVGAVSGTLMIDPSAKGVGKGIDLYWKLEKLIRKSEACVDSCIGCTGAVYAIRKKLYRNLRKETLIDDVVVPMNVVNQGFRVVHDPEAIAYDPQALDKDKERIRKTRTLAGNFQLLVWFPQWLLPWKCRIWWQLISHKYLRLASPLLLCSLLVSNMLLFHSHWLFALFLCGQIAFYLLAVLGLTHGHRIFSAPGSFIFLNIMVVRGFLSYVREDHSMGWKTSK